MKKLFLAIALLCVLGQNARSEDSEPTSLLFYTYVPMASWTIAGTSLIGASASSANSISVGYGVAGGAFLGLTGLVAYYEFFTEAGGATLSSRAQDRHGWGGWADGMAFLTGMALTGLAADKSQQQSWKNTLWISTGLLAVSWVGRSIVKGQIKQRPMHASIDPVITPDSAALLVSARF